MLRSIVNTVVQTQRSVINSSINRSFSSGAPSSEVGIGERVLAILKSTEKVDPAKLTLNSTFKELGLDSLDVVEAGLAVEEEFNVEFSDNIIDHVLTPNDLVRELEAVLAKK